MDWYYYCFSNMKAFAIFTIFYYTSLVGVLLSLYQSFSQILGECYHVLVVFYFLFSLLQNLVHGG
jgi:hypothetical protein